MNKVPPVPYALALATLAAAVFAEGEAPSVRLHGYHETHANIVVDGERTLDPHRTVLGLESGLSGRIRFGFELDFEHAFEEPELEFAEVEGRVSEGLSVIAGTLLMPFGSLNENHEPPLFHSVERPLFHRDFAPTSWQEVGVGFRARSGEGAWRLRGALVNGLSAFDTADGGIRAKAVLREMKPKARFAPFRDIAGVARLEWFPALWLSLGASVYGGGVDQRREDSLQAWVTLAEADARLRLGRAEIRLEGGFGGFGGNFYYRTRGDGPSPAAAGGEFAWHQPAFWNGDQDLVPFARMEWIDPDARGKALTGYLAYTGGLSWYPIPQLAVKADFQRFTHRNPRAYALAGGPTGEVNVINLGFGLMYP